MNIGKVDNEYRTFYLKVPTEILKIGENLLEIQIESSIRYAFVKAASYQNAEAAKVTEKSWLKPSFV